MSDHGKLDAAIAALNLQYAAHFVPQSISRNSQEKRRSLNWRVTISNGKGRVIATDYMQGTGHIPHDVNVAAEHKGASPYCIMIDDYNRRCAESGKYGPFHERKIPAPELRDVLYCLVSDASALDARSFEDWASEYGYDADSRKAEQTYRDCLQIGRDLEALIGRAALAELRDLFSDY